MRKIILLISCVIFVIFSTNLIFDSYDIELLDYNPNTESRRNVSMSVTKEMVNKNKTSSKSTSSPASGTGNQFTKLNDTQFYLTNEYLELIKGWESFLPKTEAKDDGYDIGYGFHDAYYDGEKYVDVVPGMTMTKDEANYYLRLELEIWIKRTVGYIEKYGWKIEDFNNNQVLALTDYFFNRGTLEYMREILYPSNSPTIEAIGNNFPKYWGTNYSSKDGLINRRNYEKKLFFSKDFGTPCPKAEDMKP